MTILNSKSIYYDDVNLLARPCVVKSRKDVPVETNRIIVSPMASIVGKKFIEEASRLGLNVCVHRFQSIEDQIKSVSEIPNEYFDRIFFAIGLSDIERIKAITKFGGKNFIIDIASGYMLEDIASTVHLISKYGYLERLIVGNVHTKEGYLLLTDLKKYLKENEVIVRVGIGNGAQCLTKHKTGFNRGQITEISDVRDTMLKQGIICADGGIKNSGDAVKAFAAGSEMIMLGSFFANAEEAECQVQGHKMIWGGASRKQAELLGKVLGHAEGRESAVEGEIKPLRDIVQELWSGIASGVSYSGYSSLTDLIGNGLFEIKI